MFLEDRKIEGLLDLIRLMSMVPPWKDPQGFLSALHRVVPFDRSVAFLKVDPATHRIIPSQLTLTNLSSIDSLQDHNNYFWQFKQPIIDRLADQKFLSFHFPTTVSVSLSKNKFQEYRHDYWKKYQIQFSYACYVKTPHGYLATYLSRTSSQQDFSEEERKILDLLSPHLELIACATLSDSATLFTDSKGLIVWTDSRADDSIKDPLFAARLRATIPGWLGQLSLDPFKPLRFELKEKGVIHHFSVSQSGFGHFPLFRICWTSTQERSPLPEAVLLQFARQHHLSPREQEVLLFAVAGKQMKEMAQQLGLATDTVKEYLGSVYRKVGVDGRGTLVARVLSQLSPPVQSSGSVITTEKGIQGM
jgi:DNA-binding CsgD family transcriptional regulator